MKRQDVYIVNAFTNHGVGGNPAGVVVNADDLTSEEMQRIAHHVNLSETAFILNTQSKDAHIKVRYFSPTDEIDFCGHATVALSYVLWEVHKEYQDINPLLLETNVGIIPIEWKANDRKLNSIKMTQVEPQFKEIHESVETIFDSIGIDPKEYDSRYPIKKAYTGNWDLLVPIREKSIIDGMWPDMNQLAAFHQKIDVTSVHLFTFDINEDEVLLYTRNFAPLVGIDEDWVTGSTSGALAGYLIQEGILPAKDKYKIKQGNSANSPGLIYIETNQVGNKVIIEVGGEATIRNIIDIT